MPSLSVIPVQSRREKKQFLELPWRLYEGDENWIPPLRGNQKELVNYKGHAFYEKNEIQTFLALRNGQPCGRVRFGAIDASGRPSSGACSVFPSSRRERSRL